MKKKILGLRIKNKVDHFSTDRVDQIWVDKYNWMAIDLL